MLERLGRTTREILNHVARYQMTTPAILRRVFFPDDPDAWKSPMKTLRGKFLADPAPPLHPSAGRGDVYYHLTPQVADHLGLPEKFGRPIPQVRRAEVYGTLLFCTMGKDPRPLFLREEFNEAFPMAAFGEEIKERFYRHRYFLDIDEAGNRRLARLLIDEGSDLKRIIQKLGDAYDDAAKALPQFIRDRRFSLALVTAFQNRKRALDSHLRYNAVGPLDAPIRVTVEAYPELEPLLAAKESSRGVG
jgi:hypothetical protein